LLLGQARLDDIGAGEETKAARRMREIAGRATAGLEDAPWDLDGFAPADEREAVPHNNIRSWR